MLAPGGTIGILGGGQLGRMLAIAAAQLGYRTHIYTPERDSVAAEVAAEATVAPFTDPLALPGGTRRLLVVQTDRDVALLDLADLSIPEITIRLTTTNPGLHQYALRTENLRIVSPMRWVASGDAAPRVAEWKGRRVAADAPWMVVAIEDGVVSRRRELFVP